MTTTMATNLYDVLGIPKDATPEQIRKAYKQKALKTHPDRLPPGASAADKANAEEQFRIVNNAYEVLSDPQNRRVYDLHGVWPPPERLEEPLYRSGPSRRPDYSRRYQPPSGRPWPDPFPLREDPFREFVFTDPFVLFENIFGDMPRMRSSSPRYHPRGRSHSRVIPFQDPFDALRRMHAEMGSFMNSVEPTTFSGFGPRLRFPSTGNFSNASIEAAYNNDGQAQWASESRMTSVVNGVSQSVWKRRDWDGNEHVTRTYPDGRETLHINGVEQPSPSQRMERGVPPFLPAFPSPNQSHLPPPPLAGHQPHNGSRTEYAVPPPPTFTGSFPPPINQGYKQRRDRSRSESVPQFDRHHDDVYNSGPVIPDVNRHHDTHTNSKRKWWRGGF